MLPKTERGGYVFVFGREWKKGGDLEHGNGLITI